MNNNIFAKSSPISYIAITAFFIVMGIHVSAQKTAKPPKQTTTIPVQNANPTIGYLDADGDGYFIELVVSVNAPGCQWKNTATALGDCNDTDPNVQEAQT